MTPCRPGLHDKDEPTADGLPGRSVNGRCRRCQRIAAARYAGTEKGRSKRARQNARPSQRALRASWQATPAGQERHRDSSDRYRGTAKGMLTKVRSDAKQRGAS